MAAAAPARSRSLTCCCKGISETSLAPGEVGGRLERGPEGRADRRRRARAGARGGVGSGEGGWPCRGRVRGRRDRPKPGSRRAGGSGCPLSPPAPPPAAASSPVTGASSAHVCETSPAGPGERDRTGRRDGNTAAPARPLSPGGGEGDRAGKEGVRGEAGQGQAWGPARKARALGPRGRYRCHRQDAPRPGRPLASPSPPDSPRPSLHPTAGSTAAPAGSPPPPNCPQLLCCRELQIPKCDKRSPT